MKLEYNNKVTSQEYTNNWKEWINIAERQRYVSKYLFPDILSYFSKDQVLLELGAGIGQLCDIAQSSGYSVIGSDYCDEFVAYMKEKNIEAVKINALDMQNSYKDDSLHGVYAQGLSVLVTKDEKTILDTYKSIYKSLSPSGRFVFIFPRGSINRYSRAFEHEDIYRSVGFKKIVSFRQQAFPALMYKYLFVRLSEKILGRFFGIRNRTRYTIAQ